MKNHYQTLGIRVDATQEEIKTSYRKLALKFHPDKNNGDLSAASRFTEIQEAYQVLSNAQKRQTFDKFWIIYFDEQKEYLTTEEENIPNIRDHSSIFIGLAAALIFVSVILYFYFSVNHY
jgi:curved DNA-binding protein CbpA